MKQCVHYNLHLICTACIYCLGDVECPVEYQEGEQVEYKYDDEQEEY